MKKVISCVLLLAMILSSFSFSAFATDVYGHESCTDQCRAINPPDSPNADVCHNCGAQAVVLACGGGKGSDQGTHTRLGYGKCTFTIYYRGTLQVCNACGYRLGSSGQHACSESHECPLGVINTCVAGR